MTSKRHRALSDIPKEGQVNKRVEILLSPSASEIESQIACAEPQIVDTIREEIERIRDSSVARLRSQVIAGKRGSVQGDDYSKPLTGLSEAELNRRMSTPARDLFGLLVLPLDLLPHFHEYDPSVLTNNDLSCVRSTTLLEGNEVGATELYDRLQNYEAWFPCTVDVLRDARVNMQELAELLLAQLEVEKATNEILEDPDNMDRIAEALKKKFRMTLKPLDILHLFHKYDPGVLVQEDLDIVRDITLREGDEVGSGELLDRLIRYPGWYPCLMKVLRDPGLGLEELADEMTGILTDEFQELQVIQQQAKEALLSRVLQFKKRAKEAKKRRKKTFSEKSLESSDFHSVSRAHRIKQSRAWQQLLRATNRNPRYPGLDWNKELGPHAMDHVPDEVEMAEHRAQMIYGMDKDEVVGIPGLHERMLDPWAEGEKYAEKYALTELFKYLLTRLVLDTPNKPVDYLIELTREINRLNAIRQEVADLAERKRQCEMEAVEKPTNSVRSLHDSWSTASQKRLTIVPEGEEVEQAGQSRRGTLQEQVEEVGEESQVDNPTLDAMGNVDM